MGAAEKIEQYREIDQVLLGDLQKYSAALVQIKNKDSGELMPFRFKTAQMHVHRALEEQRERTGKVRALILKYRQGGISTYMSARFYQKTSMSFGKKTYILTHEHPATQNLFGMAKRIHEHIPVDYRPRDTAKNANELWFGRLDSGYAVGTAGNVAGTGRSQTIHFFHGSEAAYWPQAQTHMAGVLQAVPNAPGTEIVFETTANGPSGAFYDQWMLAQRGESEFIAIFLPWFWEDDYRLPVAEAFDPSAEEAEYAELYELDREQLVWAHFKNIELGGEPGKFCWLFRQEYPASAAEAFQTSGSDSLIKAKHIMAARKFEAPDQSYLPIVLGVDVARGGADRTRIIDRQGRKLGKNYNIQMHVDDSTIIGDQIALILRENPRVRMVFIDVTGVGSGVYDHLRRLDYGERIMAVNFGGTPQDGGRYTNKRAEMWGDLADWLADPGGAEIPDDDLMQAHFMASPYHYDANGRMYLSKKEQIKKDFGFSPDFGDAAALTFAAQVNESKRPDVKPDWTRKIGGGNRPWMKTR